MKPLFVSSVKGLQQCLTSLLPAPWLRLERRLFRSFLEVLLVANFREIGSLCTASIDRLDFQATGDFRAGASSSSYSSYRKIFALPTKFRAPAKPSSSMSPLQISGPLMLRL